MKIVVTASYSASPSMLMVVPMGMQKRTIRLSNLARSSKHWKVTLRRGKEISSGVLKTQCSHRHGCRRGGRSERCDQSGRHVPDQCEWILPCEHQVGHGQHQQSLHGQSQHHSERKVPDRSEQLAQIVDFDHLREHQEDARQWCELDDHRGHGHHDVVDALEQHHHGAPLLLVVQARDHGAKDDGKHEQAQNVGSVQLFRRYGPRIQFHVGAISILWTVEFGRVRVQACFEYVGGEQVSTEEKSKKS